MACTELSMDTYCQVTAAMANILKENFGPNGLNILINTSTGRVKITSSGIAIIEATNILHPLGHMIKCAVSTFHKVSGDGSKTFVVLLKECMQNIKQYLAESKSESMDKKQLSKAFDHILKHVIPCDILPKMISMCSKCTNISTGNLDFQNKLLNIISTSMHNLYNRNVVLVLSHIVQQFILFAISNTNDSIKTKSVLSLMIDNFDSIIIQNIGTPVKDSHIVDGIIFERGNIQILSGRMNHVSFIMIDRFLNEVDYKSSIISTNSKIHLKNALTLRQTDIEQLVQCLRRVNCNLLVSSEKISETLTYCCHQNNISVIHNVDIEKLQWLSEICSVPIVHELRDLHDLSLYGYAECCQSVYISQQECVLIQGVRPREYSSENRSSGSGDMAKQIVICGASDGQCEEYRRGMSNSIKCVKMWMDNDYFSAYDIGPVDLEGTSEQFDSSLYTIPSGGAFEISLSCMLQNYAKQSRDPMLRDACKILACSLLCVPKLLLCNSHSTNTRGKLLEILKISSNESKLLGLDGRCGNAILIDDHLIEPLNTKVTMFYHVAHLIQMFLRLDSIVSIKGMPKTMCENNDDV